MFAKIVYGVAMFLFAVVLAFVGTYIFPPKNNIDTTLAVSSNSCTIEARYYRKNLVPVLSEWSDAEKLANSSPRISLAPVVSQLQAIRRKMDGITPGSCVASVHDNFRSSMDESIAGFLAFMAQEPDGTVQRHFKTSTFMLETAVSLLDTLTK